MFSEKIINYNKGVSLSKEDSNINDNIIRSVYFYRQLNLSYFQIAKTLNCSVKLVYYHLNK